MPSRRNLRAQGLPIVVDTPQDRIPLPPPNAEVFTTACDYCAVGCGYKVYRWPLEEQGNPRATQNALGVDFPTTPLSGKWVSPNMHNIVRANGKLYHVVVIPDGDTQVVNKGGDHSIRGGTLAQKVYNPEKPTRDRLKTPLLRVRGKFEPINWERAIKIIAEVSKHVLSRHGELAWGMKTYSYEYYENTYAI
ncbi:MAG: molybdopterin-dependent oxidoreductase, partial [Dehalococcoidia bacterium]